MKILIQFAFASACLLGVHVCDSSAADRYSRTSDFSYWHAPAITPTKVERPVFGPHILTFDSFSEDDQELEFLMWLGVDLSPDREGYDCQGHGERSLRLEGGTGNDTY